jgi:hypothetical protein
LITLLTDFGTRDEYAGVMKGVIAGIAPDVRVVDICHHIEPQNIVHGAFILAAATPYFPAGSVHAAVVDPGVGGKRRILAVDFNRHLFVVPDNGLIEGVLAKGPNASIVSVENENYFLHPVSRTFQGRDIFAPVAAHLAAGLPLSELGPAVDRATIVTGMLPHCDFPTPNCIEGRVVTIDRFGNLMTNIDAASLARLSGEEEGRQLMVSLVDRPLGVIVASYHQVPKHTPLAMLGSRGFLEIAINCGNAKEMLKVGEKEKVRVQLI